MKTYQQLIFETSVKLFKKINIPAPISSKLSYFQKSIRENEKIESTSKDNFFQSSSQLYLSFNKLSQEEKIHHFCVCIDFLNYMINDNIIKIQQKIFQKPLTHVVATKKSGILGFSEKIMVIIDHKNRTLFFTTTGKKQEKLKLKNFFMRQSKDNKKNCLIFQRKIKSQSISSFRLFFQQHVFIQIKNILRTLLDEVEKENLYYEITKNNNQKILSPIQTCVSISSPKFRFLNQQNIKLLLSLRNTLKQNQDEQCSVQRMELLKYSYKSITTNGNNYYLQQIFCLPKNDVVKALSSNKHEWNSLCYESSVIESSDNETVIMQNYLFNGVKYQTCYIKHFSKDRFLIMSIANEEVLSSHPLSIDFIYIKIVKINNQTTQISVKARIQTMDSNRSNFIEQFLKQFSNIYDIVKKRQTRSQMKIIINNQDQTIYYDAKGQQAQSLVFIQKQDYLAIDTFQTITQLKQNDLMMSTKYSSLSNDSVSELQCLKYKHFMHPQTNSELKIARYHYLDAQWVRNKHGGLLCINQRILTEQKKVLKHVFTSVGKNLFTNKSIMNISLPASVCTKFSHLKMIASNFIYAPLLVQTTQTLNSVERMKNLITFLITIGNTGISSQKPFNPILGETFQGIINGCPIYLEQISHHPAISSYLMQGRGYKIIGSIEPKVEATGINSVRCYSQKQNKICFDDGSTVYMSFPKIILKGLLFGNRQFLFEGTNYIYDDKNDLYAQITFGAQKSILGGLKSDADQITGKIYRLNSCFKNVFKNKIKKDLHFKDYILQQISQFKGTWTQQIKFDNKLFFNFRTQLPCILQEYPHPLPSDSQFRTDIQKLCDDNLQQAQLQKQRLEDLQRKDKALREKYKKIK